MKRISIALAIGLGAGVACSVTFPDDLKYSCATDADCAGADFKCVARAGKSGYCCRVTGPELCDGLDNDCNGIIDDGFDLRSDSANCGSCNHPCSATEHCVASRCTPKPGADCSADGGCADPTCELKTCALGCLCRGGVRTEALPYCNDGVDNDTDGFTDCADSDCDGGACGDGGCTCIRGVKTETNCYDTRDNDDDTAVDCADTDCEGKFCAAGASSLRCSGGSCLCNGGAPMPENTPLACRDGIDNDCNGKTDCQEIPGCDTKSCSPDGGGDCVCAGGAKFELNCKNALDDDGDSLVDCADPDCLFNSCVTDAGTIASCHADHLCRP